ncbi:gliding motility-associated ABC transporter substrate-binding protein GldG [Flavobacteriaceae bacterium 14752]|uniref:gliding motility-associated ABC transporter substrate-binding protein GldG n=1 Tax=Mesohalobacter salilacus TaxID=2491711 RepID=UPI000F63C2CA|nr:gliding motility-associated ABC transporter substrate-binding protein GldG [Flavobacteriaceae bacterium 14752]
MKKQLKSGIIIMLLLLVVNVISYHFYKRFDFTSDGRFTISQISENLIDSIESPLKISVFLKGELNGEFKRLQRETQFLLEEFKAQNPQIRFEFINPVGEKDNPQQVGNAFYQNGMMPENLSVMKNGKLTKTLIFPWAVVKYKGQQMPVHLLNKKLNANVESMINSSVQNLEYAFTDVFLKLSRERKKKIAVLRSNGELEDRYLTDFLSSIREYYLIAPFSLDSVQTHPQKVLKELQKFDAIIEAKPTEAFTDKEIYVLDQYIMNGGKALWMVESVAVEKDSLKQTGSTIAMPRDLNLLNLFFKYGIRINYELINDVYSAPIYLAAGKAEDTQLSPYPWFYEPLAKSPSKHPIVSNINAVKFEFANSLDTLKNGISKTVLLQSSELSRAEDVPREISLNMINVKPTPEQYPKGNFPLAVLLEGEFTSVYKNRITPFEYNNSKDKSIRTKQIVIADGDVVKNEIAKGEVLSLGFDRFTGDTYGNKTFLTNALNYLLGDEDLVKLRNKQINIPQLNPDKILNESTIWQVLNIGIGILLIMAFGIFMYWFRQNKYR